MSYAARLKKMSRKWKEERVKTGATEFDDGKYEFRVTLAEVAEFDKVLKLVLTYTFTDGQYKGQEVKEYLSLEDEERLVWTARRIASLGYDVEDFELAELETWCKQVNQDKPEVAGSLKTKGDWQNVRIDGPIDGGAEAEPVDDDDEAPTFTAGDAVLVKVGKRKVPGVVKSIRGDKATVETDDAIVKCDVADLTAQPDEDDDADEDEDVKPARGKKPKPKADADDEEEEEEEEEEAEESELEPDDAVEFKVKGVLHQGTVIDVDDDTVRVTSDKTGKTFKLKPSEVTRT